MALLPSTKILFIPLQRIGFAAIPKPMAVSTILKLLESHGGTKFLKPLLKKGEYWVVLCFQSHDVQKSRGLECSIASMNFL